MTPYPRWQESSRFWSCTQHRSGRKKCLRLISPKDHFHVAGILQNIHRHYFQAQRAQRAQGHVCSVGVSLKSSIYSSVTVRMAIPHQVSLRQCFHWNL
jgi:hypothetical protein